MPMIQLAARRQPDHGNDVKARIQTFLLKLGEDDTAPGLHIEPINGSADPRVRTGRVNDYWRAILFRVDPPGGETTYVYAGTWPHDVGTEKAKRLTLQINPVNGILSFREAVAARAPDTTSPREATVGIPSPAVAAEAAPLLDALGYRRSDLTDEFGFDPDVAERAFAMRDEDALLRYAEDLDTPWQQEVLLSMAAHDALHLIKQRLQLDQPVDVGPDADEDTKIIAALRHPASQMQFTYVAGQEDLQRIIEGGDFGAWRVYLHPDQRALAEMQTSGAFRISGGAGTGKTVVLLHRTRRLAKTNPEARIVLTTFTRALAENLRRDLERLDADVPIAAHLGERGVLVRGVDQLAAEVRARAGEAYSDSARETVGSPRETTASPADADWDTAITQAGGGLPMSLRSGEFFTGEYAQIILPGTILDAAGYFAARRPGRGVALDRGKRAAVWAVVEQMRKDQRITGTLGYGEIAAISAHWLTRTATTFADHLLVDEGQDLEPAKWLFLRALVAEGPDDLFIADDSHQRIYGRPTILSHYGIRIRGRSRRLTLNYRTTSETLRYALGILAGETYEGAEGEEVATLGYRSARSGPKPVTHATKSDTEQLDLIAHDINRWIEEGVRPETIAVLAASNTAAKRVQQGLTQRGRSVAFVTTPRTAGGQPVVMTMHTAKGMEFSRVVLFDISDGAFPPSWAYKRIPDEDRADKDRQFRSLLYVAASRARDELVVTWKGAPSEMLLG
ncbi:3'-5' exonuclease [Microbacterium terrisoli]|uniref:3'-5' exonuclease n=1 Tax=Microbacterium terrisoli TaxID=3242192 RepID=UPI0028065B6A|nr:3'-5' exonuclease [Microbacterium protaetiae]